jgi:sialic acid synthase SpsE
MARFLDVQPLVIAELGGNHGGDPKLAADLCREASKAGANGVKFQAYKTDLFLHSQTEYYKDLANEELSFDILANLITLSHDLGLMAGLTVFGDEGIDLALKTKADYLKISSGDLNYHQLIKKAAQIPLPLIISTGACQAEEITAALALIPPPNPIVLQCTSLYPAPKTALNLSVIGQWLEQGMKAGFSDHSLGIEPSLAAMEMGAVMVEKHFTLDKTWPGGDNAMSILPEDLRNMASFAKKCLTGGAPPKDPPLVLNKSNPPGYWGQPHKTLQPGENPRLIRRWAVAAKNLSRGQKLDPRLILFQRVPLVPYPLLGPTDPIIEYQVKNDIPKGSPIALSDLNR